MKDAKLLLGSGSLVGTEQDYAIGTRLSLETFVTQSAHGIECTGIASVLAPELGQFERNGILILLRIR